MNKLIVLGGVAAAMFFSAVGLGVYSYTLKAELGKYREIGALSSMQEFSQKNFDLGQENKVLQRALKRVQSGFIEYRKKEMLDAVYRSERHKETVVASFQPLSGPFVFAAVSTQEQLELCGYVQRLVKLEVDYFDTSDPDALMQQDKICNDDIARTVIPLFKYQMLRARASMTGSLGHLRVDAEKKLQKARALLLKWNVPVSDELESYTKF